MKHTSTISTVDILHKIESIEKEVMNLKISVLNGLTPSNKKVVSLKGILKGIEITEQDINTVKKSLYSKKGCKLLMNFVADTHALLWWFTDSPKISIKASEIFEKCENGESVIFIPSIVIAESLSIFEKKRIFFNFKDLFKRI